MELNLLSRMRNMGLELPAQGEKSSVKDPKISFPGPKVPMSNSQHIKQDKQEEKMEGNTPGNMTEIPTHPKISSLELRVLYLSQNLQVKVKIIKRGRRGYIGKALGEVGT